MKKIFTLTIIFSLGTLAPVFCQKLMLTGGYTRVGKDSFSGVTSASLYAGFPLGHYLSAGVGVGTGRNRQAYEEFIPGPEGIGGRTITSYHNFLYSLQFFLAGRLIVAPRLEAALGPSAGLYLVGARERSDELKPGFGLRSNLTYKRLGGSRFNLEALFHPTVLLHSVPVDDLNFRFEKQHLFVWDAQVGISYDLKQ